MHVTFVGKMTTLVQDRNLQQSKFKATLRELNVFMRQRRLPDELQTRVRSFFKVSFPSKMFFLLQSTMDTSQSALPAINSFAKCTAVGASMSSRFSI